MTSGTFPEPVAGRPAPRSVPADGGRFDVTAAFDAHGTAILGYAVNALHDRALAEDCVQETFLRAWRARDSYAPERASERTWLFAIARHVVLDALRSRGRTLRTEQEDALDDTPAELADPLDRLEVTEALARLTPEQRRVLVDVHLRGLSYAEVSAATGVPVGTLRSRAFAGLRALRGHLDGTGEAR